MAAPGGARGTDVLRRPLGGASWMAWPTAASSVARSASRPLPSAHGRAELQAPRSALPRSLAHPTRAAQPAPDTARACSGHRADVLPRGRGRAAATARARCRDRGTGWHVRPTVRSPWLAVLLPQQATTTGPEPLRLIPVSLRPPPLPLRAMLLPLRSLWVPLRSVPVPRRSVPVPHRHDPVTHRPGSEALWPRWEGSGSGPEGHRPQRVRGRSVSEGPAPVSVRHRHPRQAHRPRPERFPPPSEPLRPGHVTLRPRL
jgi:hypothetical protein